MRGRKGLFAILGAFFLILAIIIAMIWFFGVYQIVFRVNAAENRHEQGFVNARLFKERLLQCHEKTFLSQRKLDDGSCSKTTGVAGFKVEQMTNFACAQLNWTVGATNNSEMTEYVYWLGVQQNTGKSCLAKLHIYQ